MSIKILFRQSGGVAGAAKVAQVDSAKLPGEEQARLEPLVEQALSAESALALSGRPDEEQYKIEIETATVRQTILVSRSTVPGPLEPLVTYLSSIAHYEKRTRKRGP